MAASFAVATTMTALATGCVAVQESESWQEPTDFTREHTAPPKDDDPLPVIATVGAFLSGDSIQLSGGRVVKLIGIRAPRPGEPFADEARAYLYNTIGRQLIRLVYKTGTKYTDEIWYANVIIPNPIEVQHPAGIVIPRGRGALSANSLMLAQGLAYPEGIDRMELARVIESGDRKGQLHPFTTAQNAAVRRQFKEAVMLGEANATFLYSSESNR